MSQGEELKRLLALEAKIAKAKAALESPKPAQDHHSMAQIGWRMVIKLVSGLGNGAAMGYGLDVLFGNLPFFLVILTLLGFVAGVTHGLMRSPAKRLAHISAGPSSSHPPAPRRRRRFPQEPVQ